MSYLAIRWEDLAKSKVLSEMKKRDEDNLLTVLTETLVRLNSIDDFASISDWLVELGEKNEYSLKLYNILGLSIIRSGKSNADVIYKKAMQTFKLIEGEKRVLNQDEICFLTNFVKYGPKEDRDKALELLNSVSNNISSVREEAYRLFDEACKSF